MAQDNTKLCNFSNTNNNDFLSTPIAPIIDAESCEINTALLNIVMKDQFSGLPSEDAATHLNNFVDLCDVLGFREFDDCSLNLHLADSTIKKPMGRINDVIIVENRNYVPVDFIVLDIDCNPTCPIILGRPFLRTIGAIIDMKEGNIRFQFLLRKGMEHFPIK